MRQFVMGVMLGGVLGAGGFYAVDRAVWNPSEPQPPSAEAVVVDAGFSASKKKGSRRKRRGNRRRRREAGIDVSVGGPVELSAADRDLAWRGPRIAPPDRSIDMTGQGGRPLNDDEVAGGVASLGPKAVTCVEEARGDAELAADIDVELLVGGNGRVSKVRVRAPKYLHSHGLHKCVTRAAKGTGFASTGEPTVVKFPLHLR